MTAPAPQATTKKRNDPRPRNVDGAFGWGLKQPDPGKKYVWASKADATWGLEYYLDIGYEIERNVKDGNPGARLGIRPEENAPIEKQGMVLVSTSRERADEIDQFGAEGDTGQADADRIARLRRHPDDVQRELLSKLPGAYKDGVPQFRVGPYDDILGG